MTAPFLSSLSAALDGAVLTEPTDVAPYARDWLGRREGRPLAVARPNSAEQVAAALHLCAEHGIGIVPQGGNTGMVGGATPDASGRQVVLSLSRMNRIRALDAVGDVVVAEAGCTDGRCPSASALQGRRRGAGPMPNAESAGATQSRGRNP